MNDPFDPLDPKDYLFGTGYPFEDPLNPFATGLDPLTGHFGTEAMPFDPLPGVTPETGGLMSGLPCESNLGALPFLDGITLSGLVPGLDETGFLMSESGPTVRDSVGFGTDVLDMVEDSVFSGGPQGEPLGDPWPSPILDELEASIERQMVAPSIEIEPLPDTSENQRIYGFSSPGPKIDNTSKRTYERQYPVRLWRPKGSRGIHRISRSKRKRKGQFIECPRTGQMVALGECEGC